MLNAYQFSSAKSFEKAKLMQEQVYKADGSLKSFSQFRDDASNIQTTVNETWLRVERDMCTRSSIIADKWADMVADADINPYWIYSGVLDSRERPEHRALEGLIFRIGDSEGDKMCPPVDWNCRCRPKPIDDRYLRAHNRSVQTNTEAKGWLEGIDPDTKKPFVDEQFRYNPYDQGMMPNKGRYFDQWKGANDGRAATYGKPKKGDADIEHMSLRKFTDVNGLVEEWKEEYHVDNLGNVVFQNKALYSNVFLTPESVHAVHKHPRGADLLPRTIERPDEVWMTWANPSDQTTVLKNYLLFGKGISYIVQTRNGVVKDGYLISKGQSDKYRVGCPWFKS